MAIRRVTRFVDKDYDPSIIGARDPWERSKPLHMEYDDGKEEPQVKTRERRYEGHAWKVAYGENMEFANMPVPRSQHDCAMGNPCMPATLIIHEPVQEPTLLEAAQAVLDAGDKEIHVFMDAREALKAAIAREKQKSTR